MARRSQSRTNRNSHPTSLRRASLVTLMLSLLLAGACGRSLPEPDEAMSGTTAAPNVSTRAPEGETSVPGGSTPTGEVIQEETAVTEETNAQASGNPAEESATAASRESLSVYPGILRAITLPKEEVMALLGPEHETYANLSFAYTMYTWNAYGISLEYDDLSGKLTRIQTGERTLFLEAADYRWADLDGNGIAEGVCAYEVFTREDLHLNNTVDPLTRRQGYVTVIDEATGKSLADTTVPTFGGHAQLSFLTAYGAAQENLIVLDTQAEWECDVLSYTGGQLVSMLPSDLLQLEGAQISTSERQPSHVQVDVPSVGLSFQSALPDRLIGALEEGQPFVHRFMVNRRPVVSQEGLSLRIRHSLQVQLGEATTLDGTPIGRYIDVGQITQTYRYLGSGKWKLLSTSGGAKYANSGEGSNLAVEEMAVGQTYLFSTLYDMEGTYGIDPSRYTDFDLIAGLRFMYEGLRIEVVNARIARMEADTGCLLETVRGLKSGDTRETSLSLLGMPDKGYFEDRLWTYWFYRDFGEPGTRLLSLDSLTLEFSGDKVVRIRMEGYVPIE